MGYGFWSFTSKKKDKIDLLLSKCFLIDLNSNVNLPHNIIMEVIKLFNCGVCLW